ncbi:hypothetical protein ASPZODRAFT_172715 [Penicilliopsis zonata CBS 506.65]|uniref:MIT domain-containing protein n=1 Tax=Penicilliopsis zonata CBS 506.65 TaxID=1073090 RepID=A0A1L9STA5_9EURO|nr:hypothetical protein ASPZODRAFT_172715 [Penicilliopsis zonata CBS 506.65]OJJ50445.1 hypothetical protein ASPZODRAFT_172715 [Penicilliopsis zonata CBS 506.65]
MIRVNELERLDFSVQQGDSKALPQRPLSEESFGDVFQPFDEGEKPFDYNISRQEAPPLSHGMDFNRQRLLDPGRIPPRRQSLLPSPLDDRPSHTVAPPGTTSSTSNHGHSHSSSSWHKSSNEHFNELDRSLDGDLLFSFPNEDYEDGSPYPEQPQSTLVTAALKGAENESTSWLDTIDESGASSLSSSHSQASSLYLRRKDQPFSGTEAEFDAALDAAVEAAYDEGLEPVDEPPDNSHHDDIVSTARRNVELAKQRVREAELEAKVAMTKGRELRKAQQQTTFGYSTGSDLEYLDEEAEEEERLLEEMTKGYVMDDFEFDLQSKSALPRQSDSSGHSGTTWGSSAASHPGTGHLSPLVEDDLLPTKEAAENLDVLHHAAAPSTSMHTEEDPRIIPPLPKQVPTLGPSPGPGVRARRLSGQNLKELKIETNSNVMASATSRQPDPVSIISASLPQMTQADALQSNLPAPMANSTLSNLNRRNLSISSISEANLLTSTVMKPLPPDVCDTESSTLLSPVRPFGKVPSAPDIFGKAVSNMKSSRSTSISNLEPFTDSPTTPSSSTFPPLESQTATLASPPPVRPTPTALTFTPISQPTGGLYLFDSNIHSPTSPGSPNPSVLNAPLPLEPCPESFMLRPFWLMRCIYQSIANPRGGYLSKKLFLPRDVWHVKNVKIKAVEEKVFNCDLLTAALLKLALVDTYDADAVLEEMQLLEAVLDQVQTSLSKKLGSEVGVQSAMPLFKTASTTEDPATPSELLPSKSSAGQGKSYLTSWRKLRSKSSGHGTTAQLASVNYAGKDNLTLNSLPMTATPSAHRVKRDVTNLQFNGPNANYMGALARLCDAAQVLDQIAQQVEDPGLKHSSETLVGLELSTRHAAEFFGFYICRFALGDINLMLDKFIKRGSEWVLI